MTAITRALSAALLHFVWQGLAVMILLWLALWVLQRRSAALRYAVSCAALAILVALPAATTWMLYERPPATTLRTVALAIVFPAEPAVTTARFGWLALIQAWAIPVWSLGVLLFSIRMACGCVRISALRRSGEIACEQLLAGVTQLANRMGVTRPVRVLVSTITDSPSITGWLRPVLLLPVCAIAGLTPEQLEAVLAHELAHIRRHDYLVNLLQMAAETLLFYHPAVWWISARIRHERELCCDDLAVRVSGGALSYARALTALEKMRAVRPALALGSTDGPLFYRVRRLVMGGSEYGPSKLSGAVALALGFACFALCVHWARGQQPSQPVREPVVLEATLDKTGQVIDARVLSGPTELRKPALIWVLNRRFSSGNGTRTVRVPFEPPASHPSVDERALADQLAREVERQNLTVQLANEEVAATLQRQTSENLRRQLAEQQAKLAAAQRVFEMAQQRQLVFEQFEQVRSQDHNLMALLSSAVDKPLASIDIHDLPDDAKGNLLARLPVHVGDTLTAQSIETIEQTIKEFDEHLVFSFDRAPNGVTLRIYPSKDFR